MKKYFLIVALTLSSSASAEISTEEDAAKFLRKYCITLVNEISKAVDSQKVHASRGEWEEFMKQGAYISGVSNVYSNLCKK